MTTHEEKKDKLLELYRQVAGVNLSKTIMPDIWEQIEALEKELK